MGQIADSLFISLVQGRVRVLDWIGQAPHGEINGG
jgi:hypothetical protein